MNPFSYTRAGSVADAIAAAAQPGAAYLGGGTNLMDLMKGGIEQPVHLVDVTRLPGLDRIERQADGGVRVGALVRNSDLAWDEGFRKDYPVVAEALRAGASAQLRNAATTAGNLMQRTRCLYFYDTASACNKREPGSGCDAFEGFNRLNAILGWSDKCTATHPSDFCVPLAALDATVEIEGPKGPRTVPLEEFHRLPGDHPERDTVLEPGELILAVRLPPAATGFAGNARYLKVRDRNSYAFALVSAAAALRLEGGRIQEARLAFGGVAHKPWRARAAEESLAGAAPDRDSFERAAARAVEGAKGQGGNDFKVELARRTAVRAFLLAARGTPAELPALPASPFSGDSHA